jgi:hypothetical protein
VEKIALVVFTDGRLRCLKEAIDSAEENLKCVFKDKLIVNDEPSAYAEIQSWYSSRGFEIISNAARYGYCYSIKRAWAQLYALGKVDYVFHLEDDFTFNEPIPVLDMIKILKRDPKLAQMALVRQPVNDIEIAAGSMIAACPERYLRCAGDGFEWLENNFCFTNNPCIYPMEIATYPYPARTSWPWGEGEFSAFLREKGYRFGYWGKIDQKPMVHHNEHR